MENKVSPIKPEEVAEKKEQSFPDAVFEAFNELIVHNFLNGSATIKQDDILKLMTQKGLNRKEIIDKGWLDVEGAYRAAGWKVEYDKPGFNESYPATFTFTRKGKSKTS